MHSPSKTAVRLKTSHNVAKKCTFTIKSFHIFEIFEHLFLENFLVVKFNNVVWKVRFQIDMKWCHRIRDGYFKPIPGSFLYFECF